jgi:hypothetical protein
MIIPSNLSTSTSTSTNTNTNTNTNKNVTTNSNYDVVTKINLDILDNMQIKREVYYKMNFIMKYLENHWAIKKRGDVFFFKNLETSSKEILTEDYLNRRIIDKLYTPASAPATHHQSQPLENGEAREAIETRETIETREIKKNHNPTKPKMKKDIVPLEDGIKALKHMIENQKIDINSEIKNKIYVMHFVMNTLEHGWTIRKKNDNFVFRKKHKNRDEVYSDDFLINFLKITIHTDTD